MTASPLFLMDYPQRTRLKILGHARVVDAREQPALADSVAGPEDRAKVERVFLIDIVSYDWNCRSTSPRATHPRAGGGGGAAAAGAHPGTLRPKCKNCALS